MKVRDPITKEYKKASAEQKSNIVICEKYLASSLDISERVEVIAKSESYVSPKDQNPDFIFSLIFILIM